MSQPAQYYFANGQEQKGPFGVDEMLGFGLRPDTLVWREGMPEWLPLGSVPELAARVAPVPPVAQYTAQPFVQPAVPPVAGSIGAAPFVAAPFVASVAPTNLAYMTPPQTLPASGMAVTAMILGIVSLVSICATSIGALVGLPCSIMAVVFGAIARGKARRQEAGGAGMALAGLICGSIYLALVLIGLVIVMIVGVAIISGK